MRLRPSLAPIVAVATLAATCAIATAADAPAPARRATPPAAKTPEVQTMPSGRERDPQLPQPIISNQAGVTPLAPASPPVEQPGSGPRRHPFNKARPAAPAKAPPVSDFQNTPLPIINPNR